MNHLVLITVAAFRALVLGEWAKGGSNAIEWEVRRRTAPARRERRRERLLLTVVATTGETFEIQAGPETLDRTNLGTRRAGDRVNLERALKVGARLGGHFVQGHIDTTATLHDRRQQGEWEFLAFRIDPAWTPLLVSKGSIAVDGVSLTLVDVWPDAFSVMLIPHTLAMTTLGMIRPGDRVNIEVDMLAKHVQKLLGK